MVSSAISHDLLKGVFRPGISERGELIWARVSAAFAVVLAGYLGVNPPGFVAQVVAFAFGLAAASFFPAIILGIFSRRMNREGAVAGMISGIAFTAGYIIHFNYVDPAANTPDNWFMGISPEGNRVRGNAHQLRSGAHGFPLQRTTARGGGSAGGQHPCPQGVGSGTRGIAVKGGLPAARGRTPPGIRAAMHPCWTRVALRCFSAQ